MTSYLEEFNRQQKALKEKDRQGKQGAAQNLQQFSAKDVDEVAKRQIQQKQKDRERHQSALLNQANYRAALDESLLKEKKTRNDNGALPPGADPRQEDYMLPEGTVAGRVQELGADGQLIFPEDSQETTTANGEGEDAPMANDSTGSGGGLIAKRLAKAQAKKDAEQAEAVMEEEKQAEAAAAAAAVAKAEEEAKQAAESAAATKKQEEEAAAAAKKAEEEAAAARDQQAADTKAMMSAKDSLPEAEPAQEFNNSKASYNGPLADGTYLDEFNRQQKALKDHHRQRQQSAIINQANYRTDLEIALKEQTLNKEKPQGSYSQLTDLPPGADPQQEKDYQVPGGTVSGRVQTHEERGGAPVVPDAVAATAASQQKSMGVAEAEPDAVASTPAGGGGLIARRLAKKKADAEAAAAKEQTLQEARGELEPEEDDDDKEGLAVEPSSTAAVAMTAATLAAGDSNDSPTPSTSNSSSMARSARRQTLGDEPLQQQMQSMSMGTDTEASDEAMTEEEKERAQREFLGDLGDFEDAAARPKTRKIDLDFTFGLIYPKTQSAPSTEDCATAASEIVPNTLGRPKPGSKNKNTQISYEILASPTIKSVDVDPDFDSESGDMIRYLVVGAIPVQLTETTQAQDIRQTMARSRAVSYRKSVVLVESPDGGSQWKRVRKGKGVDWDEIVGDDDEKEPAEVPTIMEEQP